MPDRFFYIGITHDNAPLPVRERVQPDADKQRAMLGRLSRLAHGRMVLATCERFEIYAHQPLASPTSWIEAVSEWFHVPVRLLQQHARTESGTAVGEHLLRVAAGLESRIVGEAPILGQVKSAFQQAIDCRSMDPELAALGRAAIRAGKRARHETAISDGARSIATLAVDRIAAQLGSIRELSIVVLGSGKLACEVLSDLALRRAGRTFVVGRNAERADALARRFAATAAPFGQLATRIHEADAVVACTSAGSYVVDGAVVGAARPRPLCLVDLSVPRNIDPTLTHTANVHLTHIDGLSCARSTRADALAATDRILREELADLLAWIRHRRAAPMIAQMLQNAGPAGRAPGVRRELHERIVRLKAEAAA